MSRTYMLVVVTRQYGITTVELFATMNEAKMYVSKEIDEGSTLVFMGWKEIPE